MPTDPLGALVDSARVMLMLEEVVGEGEDAAEDVVELLEEELLRIKDQVVVEKEPPRNMDVAVVMGQEEGEEEGEGEDVVVSEEPWTDSSRDVVTGMKPLRNRDVEVVEEAEDVAVVAVAEAVDVVVPPRKNFLPLKLRPLIAAVMCK